MGMWKTKAGMLAHTTKARGLGGSVPEAFKILG